MENRLFVTPAPHLRHPESVTSIMWKVVIALLPALVASYIFFGWRALALTGLGIVAAVATEAIIQLFCKKPLSILDGSAVVTGMLLAFNLPSGVPWWIPVAGSIFAIAIGKMVFGGLGNNPVNPALLGRAFLMASWPVHMTADWGRTAFRSMSGLETIVRNTSQQVSDFISSATPLAVAKTARTEILDGGDQIYQLIFRELSSGEMLKNLFLGNVSGCIGEISAIALLIGAIYLAFYHIIDWRIPTAYLGTVAVLSWIMGGGQELFTGQPLFHLLSGGLFLGAFFMATDMVTSPVTKKGRLWFGIGCGVLTVAIRLYGGYPEGVSYSILLMNLAVPLLDKLSPKKFGEVAKNA